MAVLADALRTRARGHLGAASLPRHLRRRATSHRPHKLSLKRRPNAKRRSALEARGLDPSADGAAAYAFALAVRTKRVRVHWCRAARRRPERARRADVESRRARTRATTEGRVDDSDNSDAESDAESDVDHLMAIEDVCGHLSDANADANANANAVGDGPPRRLETHLWHAKRFEMRRRWGVVSAERRPGRGRGWRAFDRHARTAAVAHDASHHAAFALVGDRASIDATIRARIDADARDATASLAFARGEIAVDAAILDDRGVPVAPVMFLRSSTDDDVAMAWTPAAAAETVGRILDDAARPRGVETRRADDATTRVEVCGATARAVVDAILGGRSGAAVRGALGDVDGEGVVGEACEVPRGVVSRVRTAGDPREAAWAARRRAEDAGAETTVSENEIADASDVLAVAAKSPEDARVPATPSEYAAYRASRNARAFGLTSATSATSASATSAPPASCPLTIVRRARGASALARAEDPGYTLIAPAGWSLPLWLALIHLGARAAGRTEWCWLARRAGAATFPEDFPDHLAAERGCDDDDDERTRGQTRGAVPRGKRAVIGANASTDFETLRRDANDVVLRSRDAWAAATKTKTTGGRGSRRRQKWTRARSEAGDEVGDEVGDGNARVRKQNPGDARPGASSPSSRPGRWVRVLVRCPWGGRPSKGAPVLAPSTAAASAAAGRRRRVAPDADRRVAIGVVTSVSAPAASVGLASALVNVDALVKLRAGSKSGGATRVDLRVPSSSPAAVVPATIEVAVESAATDPTWW